MALIERLRGRRFFANHAEGPSRRPRNSSDGPPDLDELWRDFQHRLSRLFGGSGNSGGGGGGSGGESRQAGIGVLVVIAALVFIWGCTGFYSVQEGQVGVVSTFGRYSSTTGSGLQWRAPWPIQANEIVDVFQQRKVEVGMRGGPERLKEALMLTDDENIVDVQFVVQYRVKDGPDGARDFVYGSRFSKDARDSDPGQIVLEVAESAMREVVGRRKMDEVLFGSRQQIADDVRTSMQGMLDRYRTGLLIAAVAIQNAQPPDQVQAAFDDASKAVQDRVRQKNEGEAYENDVVPRARGNAARLLQEAEGYRVRVVESAEGDAARFREVLTEYSKAPAVTRERMYLDTMQQIFSNTSKLLIDSHNNSQLLYLPLDHLIQQSSAADSNSHAASAATPAPVPSEPSPMIDHSRDAGRSRDREGR
jgi:membrane protease subunit HflK